MKAFLLAAGLGTILSPNDANNSKVSCADSLETASAMVG